MRKIRNPFLSRDDYSCFGCSPKNECGLQLEFFEDNDEVVSFWEPQKHFEGFDNVLHGGIQATMMDEVAAWEVFIHVKTGGMTTKMEIQYKKTVYTNKGKITIRAKVREMIKNIAVVDCYIYDGENTLCSQGEVYYFTYPEAIAKKKLRYPDYDEFFEKEGEAFSITNRVPVEKEVYELLLSKKKKAIFAESCTGGLLSKMLTDIPGSSDVFYGGVVVYDNLLKEKLLGVLPETLKTYGAVSAETAVSMVEGLSKIADADYFVSVTGVAGPGGGSLEKPVGTVFIGFGKKAKNGKISIFTGHFHFSGGRETVRQKTAMKVFETLRLDLTNGGPGDDFK